MSAKLCLSTINYGILEFREDSEGNIIVLIPISGSDGITSGTFYQKIGIINKKDRVELGLFILDKRPCSEIFYNGRWLCMNHGKKPIIFPPNIDKRLAGTWPADFQPKCR